MGLVWNDKKGNMYPWVDAQHTHIRGRCSHECDYCYTQHGRAKRFYQGQLTLKTDELKVNYGKNNVIFIEHMNDLFASAVPDEWIAKIVDHCAEYPENTYVFQTKNPAGAFEWMKEIVDHSGIKEVLLGTTIETNRPELIIQHSRAPLPLNRMVWMSIINRLLEVPTFVTIEPVMKFDPIILGGWLEEIRPEFVNIGADSKHCGLPEPTSGDIYKLLDILKDANIEVREKHNLGRLLDA